jgi:hypothetical protein
MIPFVLALAALIIGSRLMIANQPVLGIKGTFEAVRNLDIVALTPGIIHAEHIGAGMLIGIGVGLVYAALGNDSAWGFWLKGKLALGLAIAVTLFEVIWFLATGGMSAG